LTFSSNDENRHTHLTGYNVYGGWKALEFPELYLSLHNYVGRATAVSKHHTMKAYKGSGGRVPLITSIIL
jgi:hypothetical protein